MGWEALREPAPEAHNGACTARERAWCRVGPVREHPGRATRCAAVRPGDNRADFAHPSQEDRDAPGTGASLSTLPTAPRCPLRHAALAARLCLPRAAPKHRHHAGRQRAARPPDLPGAGAHLHAWYTSLGPQVLGVGDRVHGRVHARPCRCCRKPSKCRCPWEGPCGTPWPTRKLHGAVLGAHDGRLSCPSVCGRPEARSSTGVALPSQASWQESWQEVHPLDHPHRPRLILLPRCIFAGAHGVLCVGHGVRQGGAQGQEAHRGGGPQGELVLSTPSRRGLVPGTLLTRSPSPRPPLFLSCCCPVPACPVLTGAAAEPVLCPCCARAAPVLCADRARRD